MNVGTALLSKQFQVVGGKRLAYHERGEGDAIVFLHLGPRLVHVRRTSPVPRRPPRRARPRRITFVVHDWGSALAFDWAYRHSDRVAGIAYMEAIVAPIDLDDWGPTAASFFRSLRSDDGDDLILDKNLFVEAALPAGVVRDLTDDEMAEYRRPFAEAGEPRRPMLSWPRQLPFDGEPAEVVEIVESYGQWMAHNEVPKLFVNGEPGWILTGRARDFCRTWPAQTEVTVAGKHYLQEDSAELIGAAVSEWLASTRQEEARVH